MAFSARSVLFFLFGALAFLGVSLAAPQDMSGFVNTPRSGGQLAQNPSPVKPRPDRVRNEVDTTAIAGTIAIARGVDSKDPEYLGCLTTNGEMADLSRETCSDNISLGSFGDPDRPGMSVVLT